MFGFEVFGLLIGLTGPIQQLLHFRKQLKDRFQAYRENDQKLAALLQLYQNLLRQLSNVQTCIEFDHASSHIPPEGRSVFAAKIEDSTNDIQTALQTLRLQTQTQQSRRNSSKFANAISLRDEIASLSEHAKEVEHFILDASSQNAITAVTSNGIENILNEVRLLPAQVTASMQVQMRQMRVNTVQRGMVAAGFKASRFVTENPPWVCHDFTSTDSTGVPITTEGKLKNAVMEGSRGKCVDGFRSTRVVLCGMGGVGKSCAVRGLAREYEIDKRFHSADNERCGGIYSLSVDKDMEVSQAREQLANIVQNSGGWYQAMEIRQEPIFLLCVARAIEWFRDRNCLFLINIPDGNRPGAQVLAEQLSNLAECSYGSVVVLRTRDASIERMRGATRVKVEVPAEQMSRMQLLYGAHCSELDVQNEMSRDAVDYVLKVCSGLQIAIGVAGASVYCIREYRKCTAASAWEEYKSLLQRSIESNDDFLSDAYESMYSVSKVAMQLRQEHATDEVARIVEPTDLPKLYRGMCVVETEFAPFEMLRDLWDLQNVKDAMEVGRHFNRGRLGFIEKRRVGCIELTGLRTHDFLREYAAQQAEKYEGIEFWRDRRRKYATEERFNGTR